VTRGVKTQSREFTGEGPRGRCKEGLGEKGGQKSKGEGTRRVVRKDCRMEPIQEGRVWANEARRAVILKKGKNVWGGSLSGAEKR